MKLLNVLAEEVSEFENHPVQDDAAKLRLIQTKVKSLAHHRSILMPVLQELNDLNDQGKLTPALKQKLMVVQTKLKNINTQFKQFDLKVGDRKLANPLASCELALYAGPPDQYFDLTGSQVKLLKEIQDILAKAGIPPLVVLYGGRRSQQYKGINFVAMNADHSFAWRKYDPSPGAGQNWVYFSDAYKTDFVGGKNVKKMGSMNTSDFVSHPEKYLTSLPKKAKKAK